MVNEGRLRIVMVVVFILLAYGVGFIVDLFGFSGLLSMAIRIGTAMIVAPWVGSQLRQMTQAGDLPWLEER